MTQFAAILVAKWRALRNALAGLRQESTLKVVFVSVAVALLWLGTLALSWASFHALDRFGHELLGTNDLSLAELLLPRALSVFTLVLLVMLVFSNALLGFASIYRSREMQFLLVAPLPWRTLFYSRFLDVMFFSSWSSVFLGSPVLLAYGMVRHVPWEYYVAAALAFPPFVAIPAAIGMAIALLLVRAVPRLPRAALAALAIVLLGGAFAAFRARVGDTSFRETVDLAPVLELAGQAENAFLPSYWFTATVIGAARGSSSEVRFHIALLLANAAFLTFLVGELAQRVLYPGWATLVATSRRRFASRSPRRVGMLETAVGIFRGPTRWLALKDLRVFLRDPAQWSQFAIFFGVLALYVANMRTSSPKFDQAFWQHFITLLNTVACLLVLATLTTRFIFPLVSLEGRRFWILGLAPVSRRLIVRQKLLLSLAVTGPITVGLAALSSWRLALAPVPFAISIATVTAASFALSGLAVGLGSLFPDFTADEPSRVVSGMGGTLTFILSLAYVIAVATVETAALRWARLTATGASAWRVAAALAVIVALTAVAMVVPLRLGARHLEKTEF